MEMLDLYNASRQLTGHCMIRGAEIPANEYYLVAEVWTVTPAGRILVTLRSPEKKTDPNKWENTGGAVKSGETSKDAAVRELYEETGIVAEKQELVFVKTFKGNGLFVDTYFLRKKVRLNRIILQHGETEDAKLINYFELSQLMDRGLFSESIAERFKSIQKSFLDFLCGVHIG